MPALEDAMDLNTGDVELDRTQIDLTPLRADDYENAHDEDEQTTEVELATHDVELIDPRRQKPR